MTMTVPGHRAGPATIIRLRRGFAIARIGMAMMSMIAIAATGAGWWAAHHTLGGITVSQALGADDPRSTGAAITHRQQAFLVSVMHKLHSSGTSTDLGKLNALISVAQKDIVLSTGWNERLFRRIGDISSSDMEYRTLPVLRYDNVDGQDVNIVDPSAIKAEVAAAFSGDTSVRTTTSQTAPSSVVDVINGGSTTGLAGAVSKQLKQRGYTIGQTRNSIAGESTGTTVDYGTGAGTDASDLASIVGISATPQADSAVAPGHVRVTLGRGYVEPATDYASNVTSSWVTDKAMSPSADSDTTSVTPTPDQGEPVEGGKIPCVN